ncbi:hypothetical protein VTO42DRAFT_7185 [Malbranchea cinnamomea]
MRLSLSLLALGAASVAFAADETDSIQTTRLVPPSVTCRALDLLYADTIFWPGEATYTAENEHFWSPTTYGSPACVFVPKSAKQVSGAIKILALSGTKFAVRGGGHMPIRGYANTDDGVLIALSKLNQIKLSEDKSYLSVGPGRTWGEVYEYLEPHGLVVLGGRVGLVGVPGLILGGGISFYSNQHGFVSDNVIAFEVVLASGTIVTATKDNKYSDLFWALKGGGNSFGIVTRFDLKTYSSPKVCAGVKMIAGTEKDAFLNAVSSFAQHGSADFKAAIIPQIFMLSSLKATVYSSALFYDGEQCDQPALANFSAIPDLQNSYGPTTLAKYVKLTDSLIPPGIRQQFQVISSYATQDALEIVHDTFVEMVNTELSDVENLQASVAFQPVTKNFIQQGIDKGGNPQGIDVNGAPYFWMVENFSWTNPADDKRIADFTAKVTAAINDKLDAAKQKARFQYLNDAGEGQQVFQSYAPQNLKKLKIIRAKYDPFKVFTILEAGGWKVANA